MFQHGLSVAALRECIAQRASQAIKYRRLHQECSDGLGLATENFARQIVDDVVVATREGGDEIGETVRVLALHRQGRQLQTRDPALRAGIQRSDIRGREVQPHNLIEKRRRLSQCETQVGRANLGQMIPRAQPGQGQRRVGAGEYDQMEVRRHVIEPEIEGLVDRPGGNNVVVVEDQREREIKRVELVDQRGQDRLPGRRLRGLKERQRTVAETGLPRRFDGRDEIGEEAGRIVFIFLK